MRKNIFIGSTGGGCDTGIKLWNFVGSGGPKVYKT